MGIGDWGSGIRGCGLLPDLAFERVDLLEQAALRFQHAC